MNQDTLEVGNVAHPWHHSIVFLGVRVLGKVRELGTLNERDAIGPERYAGLGIDFLLPVVELAIFIEVSVLVLNRVTDVDSLAIGHVIEVADSVETLKSGSL